MGGGDSTLITKDDGMLGHPESYSYRRLHSLWKRVGVYRKARNYMGQNYSLSCMHTGSLERREIM
jgi:hypothetical protein